MLDFSVSKNSPELGEIYWLKTESEIHHPHVVVKLLPLTVCAITTNMTKQNLPGNVTLSAKEGGLEKQSIVEVSKDIEIDQSELGKFIGTLSESRVIEINTGIKFISKLKYV